MVDALCDRFESAWQSTGQPRLEDFLLQIDEQRRESALNELLRVEIEMRKRRGDSPSQVEYVSRFPNRASAVAIVFRSVENLPHESDVRLAEKSSPDQLETIARAGDTDAKMLEVRCPGCRASIKVEPNASFTELICSSCGSHFNLLNQATVTWAAPAFSKLGRFELVEQLGMGAFGSVWKARDGELDRTVAVKVPRRTAMSPDDVEKFFREARAAAQLRHPNIVSVHEVGRDGDSVYIVSDLVRGVTLDDWLSGQQPNVREAARLCAKIADALQHAHEQGVVHRDLKPANIMVDGDGEPHLMDFGLARRDVGEVTMTIEGQVLGTPAYMSPEQAQGESHTADRRSDVYSLGVILFQLLTGELPFRGNPRMLMHQVIHDEPPSPRKLNGNVPKDIETITLKCLEKDPAQRYQTAHDLAAELQRFLSGEPILGRPVSRPERGTRWMRRNKTVSALYSAVAVSLVIGTLVSSWQAFRATRAESLARQRLEAEAHAHAEVSAARSDAEANFQKALSAVNEMLTEVGRESLADVPQMEAVRRALLEKALAFYQDFMRDRSDDPQVRRETARAFQHLSDIYYTLGEHFQAQQMCRQAIDAFEKLESQFPDEPTYRHEAAQSYSQLGSLISFMANQVEDGGNKSQAAFRQAIARNEELAAEYPTVPLYRHALANNWDALGGRLVVDGDEQAGIKAHQIAIDLHTKLILEFPTELQYREALGIHLRRLAELFHRTGRAVEAQRSYRDGIEIQRKLMAEAPEVPAYRGSLALNLLNYGALLSEEPREAEQALRESASLLEQLVRDFPHTWDYRWQLTYCRADLASVYRSEGRLDDARLQFAKAADDYAPTVPHREKQATEFPEEQSHRVWLAASYSRLAELLIDGGREQEAVPYLRQAINARKKLHTEFPHDTAHLSTAVSLSTRLGSLLENGNHFEEAAKLYLEIAALLEVATPQSTGLSHNTAALNKIAWRLANLTDPAYREPRRAVELASLAIKRSETPTAWNTLGAAQFRSGDSKSAIETLKKSIELRNGGDSFDFFFMAMAYWQQGNQKEARHRYDQAIAWMDAQQPNNSDLLRLRSEAAQFMKIEGGDIRPLHETDDSNESRATKGVKD